MTVFDIYGQLSFAGARTLQQQLPSPEEARNPVVILRLRGRTALGSTLIDILAGYADQLQDANGRLYLTGLSQGAYDQVVDSGELHLSRLVRAYEVMPIIGQSTEVALADARLAGQPAHERVARRCLVRRYAGINARKSLHIHRQLVPDAGEVWCGPPTGGATNGMIGQATAHGYSPNRRCSMFQAIGINSMRCWDLAAT